MKTFTDTAGRVWEIVVNVDTVKRVRDLLDLNLLSIVEPGNDLVDRLAEDVILVCDVLFAVVKPQADQRTVSDADFGRALSGDVIDQATTALLEELIDFFPSQKRRPLLKVLEKLTSLQAKAWSLVEKTIQSEAMDRRLAAELEKLNASFGNSLGSPELTQAP